MTTEIRVTQDLVVDTTHGTRTTIVLEGQRTHQGLEETQPCPEVRRPRVGDPKLHEHLDLMHETPQSSQTKSELNG